MNDVKYGPIGLVKKTGNAIERMMILYSFVISAGIISITIIFGELNIIGKIKEDFKNMSRRSDAKS